MVTWEKPCNLVRLWANMEKAPFFEDIAEGPEGGRAWWLHTSDDVRIRVAIWPNACPKGTVLFFPGRTEYAEKYGITAQGIVDRGYTMLAVDWRGQGLADRALADKSSGHVKDFSEYQRDVDAVIAAAKKLELPKPWYLIGHSMGGCIALRALMNGICVESAAFSAPMWGLEISRALRPLVEPISCALKTVGLGHIYAPGTVPQTYVETVSFEENRLTRNKEMFDYMGRQVAAHPELAIGGPSISWLHAAMRETRQLAKLPSPNIRAYTGLGTAEKIVDSSSIHKRMADWPQGMLGIFEGAEHEILFEGSEARNRFLDQCVSVFEAKQ